MKTIPVMVCLVCMLSFLRCTASPEADYEKAHKTDSIAAYSEFLQKYPDHSLSAKARARNEELIVDLFVAGIHRIVRSDYTRTPALFPWDEILQNDKTNMLAMALKGMAEAKEGHTEKAVSCFQEVKRGVGDIQIAPQVLVFAVLNEKRQFVPVLKCPLPASVATRAVLRRPNMSVQGFDQGLSKNQFSYMEKGKNVSFVFKPSQGGVLTGILPDGSPKVVVAKIMDENISNLR